MTSNVLSRKFMLACFFSLTATVGFFMDKISGGEYVGLALAVIGMYNLANVKSQS